MQLPNKAKWLEKSLSPSSFALCTSVPSVCGERNQPKRKVNTWSLSVAPSIGHDDVMKIAESAKRTGEDEFVN